MADERLLAVREQLFQLERRMKPLEWDATRNQINEFKKKQLDKLREESSSLQKQLKELESNH